MSSRRLKKKQIKSNEKVDSEPKIQTEKKRKNIKTIKKLQEQKDTLDKQMSDLKILNLNLEINLCRQQNKETQQTEKGTINRQPTYRADQESERKENTKTQEMK